MWASLGGTDWSGASTDYVGPYNSSYYTFEGNQVTIFSKGKNNIIWKYTGFPDTMTRKYNERVYFLVVS